MTFLLLAEVHEAVITGGVASSPLLAYFAAKEFFGKRNGKNGKEKAVEEAVEHERFRNWQKQTAVSLESISTKGDRSMEIASTQTTILREIKVILEKQNGRPQA